MGTNPPIPSDMGAYAEAVDEHLQHKAAVLAVVLVLPVLGLAMLLSTPRSAAAKAAGAAVTVAAVAVMAVVARPWLASGPADDAASGQPEEPDISSGGRSGVSTATRGAVRWLRSSTWTPVAAAAVVLLVAVALLGDRLS